MVTTWGDAELWSAWPLALDAWHCEACGNVTWPAGVDVEEAEQWIRIGAEAARNGQVAEAEFYFRRLINVRPRSTAARINLATLLSQKHEAATNEMDRARLDLDLEHHLTHALHGNGPTPYTLYLLLVQLYLRLERDEEAVQYLEALLNHQDTPPPLRARAAERLSNLLFEQAIRLIEPWMARPGEASGSPGREGAARLRLGVANAERVIENRPDHAPSWWLLGKAHQALGEHEEALPAFQQAATLSPEQPDMLREVTLCHLATGDADRASRAARDALLLNAEDAGLHVNLALSHLIRGDVDAAAAAGSEAALLEPSEPSIRALIDLINEVRRGERPVPRRWPE